MGPFTRKQGTPPGDAAGGRAPASRGKHPVATAMALLGKRIVTLVSTIGRVLFPPSLSVEIACGGIVDGSAHVTSLREGIRCLKRGNAVKAIESFTAATVAGPDKAGGYLCLARAFFANKDVDGTTITLNQAFQLSRTDRASTGVVQAFITSLGVNDARFLAHLMGVYDTWEQGAVKEDDADRQAREREAREAAERQAQADLQRMLEAERRERERQEQEALALQESVEQAMHKRVKASRALDMVGSMEQRASAAWHLKDYLASMEHLKRAMGIAAALRQEEKVRHYRAELGRMARFRDQALVSMRTVEDHIDTSLESFVLDAKHKLETYLSGALARDLSANQATGPDGGVVPVDYTNLVFFQLEIDKIKKAKLDLVRELATRHREMLEHVTGFGDDDPHQGWLEAKLAIVKGILDELFTRFTMYYQVYLSTGRVPSQLAGLAPAPARG